MAEPYFVSSGHRLALDCAAVASVYARTPQANEELRTFLRFMANGPAERGSVCRFAEGSPLDLLNRGVLRSLTYRDRSIGLGDLDALKRKAFVVFDDAELDRNQVQCILELKAGRQPGHLPYHANCNLVTMMLPSWRLYVAGSGIEPPTDLRVLAFTYPNLNHCQFPLTDAVRQNLTSMIRLNAVTSCYEALQQDRPLPFILNPPGAFLRALSPGDRHAVAEAIRESVQELWRDSAVRTIIERWTSEWILLNPPFWTAGTGVQGAVNVVDADLCDIAEEARTKRGVLCPVPMMGAATAAIGNAALGDHAERAVDEFLLRICGGIHGLVGSIRYNPGIRMLPLSGIAAALAQQP